MTSNYTAESGRASGAIINAITKSGSNRIHGDAFWFLRSKVFDARNYFDTTLPPFHRNQFGGSLGGPIIKNKTFFFVSYEGIRQDRSFSFHNFVPSQAARAGNLCSIPDGSCRTSCRSSRPYAPSVIAPSITVLSSRRTPVQSQALNADTRRGGSSSVPVNAHRSGMPRAEDVMRSPSAPLDGGALLPRRGWRRQVSHAHSRGDARSCAGSRTTFRRSAYSSIHRRRD